MKAWMDWTVLMMNSSTNHLVYKKKVHSQFFRFLSAQTFQIQKVQKLEPENVTFLSENLLKHFRIANFLSAK